MATAQAIPKTVLMEVDLDLIRVEADFNARTVFDPDQLQGLSETIKDCGVTQTLMLRPTGDGHYTVVAGERRFRAAKEAGLAKVPAMVGELSDRDAKKINWIENRQRADLNPIEEAQGLKAWAEEWELTSQKAIADKAGVKPKEVGLLLRLLDLPEGVQALIASGHIPERAEKKLREVAAVSPRVAECICEYAKRKEISHTEFVARFQDLVQATARAKFTKDPPTMITTTRPFLSELVADKKVRKDLLARINAAREVNYSDPELQLGEEEEMAARAAGCLLEPPPNKHGYAYGSRYITSKEFAADLAVRIIEAIEKRAEESRKAAKDAAEASGQDDEGTASTEEKAAAERKAAVAERKEAKENAVLYNDDLGVNLLQLRGGKARKQRSLARGKAMAKLLIAQNPELAARGLRLVLSQLRTVEQKTLKSGKPGKAKVFYATTEECVEFLVGRVDRATSADELNEIVGEALVAGIEADDRVTTKKEHVGWWLPFDVQGAIEKHLAEDIKEVRPRRRPVKKRK